MSIFAIPQELSTFSFTPAGYGKNQFDAVLPQYRSEEPNEPYRVDGQIQFLNGVVRAAKDAVQQPVA